MRREAPNELRTGNQETIFKCDVMNTKLRSKLYREHVTFNRSLELFFSYNLFGSIKPVTVSICVWLV